MAVMDPLRKSPRSRMRVRIADRCSSSVMMEFDKVTPLNLTYHSARNYRAKRESTPVELLCPTPPSHAEVAMNLEWRAQRRAALKCQVQTLRLHFRMVGRLRKERVLAGWLRSEVVAGI